VAFLSYVEMLIPLPSTPSLVTFFLFKHNLLLHFDISYDIS
jgi:hypothetical protein